MDSFRQYCSEVISGVSDAMDETWDDGVKVSTDETANWRER